MLKGRSFVVDILGCKIQRFPCAFSHLRNVLRPKLIQSACACVVDMGGISVGNGHLKCNSY